MFTLELIIATATSVVIYVLGMYFAEKNTGTLLAATYSMCTLLLTLIAPCILVAAGVVTSIPAAIAVVTHMTIAAAIERSKGE